MIHVRQREWNGVVVGGWSASCRFFFPFAPIGAAVVFDQRVRVCVPVFVLACAHVCSNSLPTRCFIILFICCHLFHQPSAVVCVWEKGEVICRGQGKGHEGEGEAGERSTKKKKKKKKTATSKRSCFSNVLPHTSNGGSGKRAARERSEEEKSPGVPDCTGRGEEWEGTQRVGVAAEMNTWGDAGVS